MIRTFVFVTTRSFKNRMLSRLRRLRQPRYLVSFLAGLAYLWFVAFRRMFMSGHRITIGAAGVPATNVAIDMLALLALGAIILVWALPDSGGGLTFSETEIQFLFPAPLSRRDLIFYRIARQQPSLLISALMITFFGLRRSGFVGVWLAMVTMAIYFIAVGLWRARLRLMGIGFFARLAIVAAVLAVLSYFAYQDLGRFDEGAISAALKRGDRAGAAAAAGAPLRTPFMRAILFVPRLFAAATLPVSGLQLLVSCATLVVTAIALFEIAVRLNVSFEEASIRSSQRRGGWRTRVRMRRTGQYVMFRRIPPLFRLRGGGPPELAIVWKNLIASVRTSAAWVVVLLVLFAVLAVQALTTNTPAVHVATAGMALMLCGLFPLIGSNMFLHDMRMDLARFELLKTYPISGERLVAAEIAAPLLFVSAVEIILLLATEALLHLAPDPGPLARFATPELAVAALLLVIPFCAMQLLIRNAVPVVLPGWATRASDDVRGFAVFGQRLVILAINLAVLFLCLLPAALLFLAIFFVARHFAPANFLFALAVSTVPAVALLAAEAWAGIRLLGAQFEKIDVSTEVDAVMA